MLRRTLVAAAAATLVAVPAAAQAAPGDLDPTFGGTGIVLDAEPNNASAVARTSDGGTVVATYGWHVVKLRADGTRDPGFGTGGKVDIAFSAAAPRNYALAIDVDSQGRIVIAGYEGTTGYVVRLLADGSYDPAFGDAAAPFGAGRVPVNWGPQSTELQAMVLDAEDRPVLAGAANRPGQIGTGRIARLRATNGGLDSTLDDDGVVEFAQENTSFSDVAVDSDARIVASGRRGNDAFLARLTDTGRMDTDFGAAPELGTVTYNFSEGREFGSSRAESLAVSDTGITFGGLTARADSFLAGYVTRIRPNGTLDPSFGVFYTTSSAIPYDVAVAPDGGVLVADYNLAVTRLTSAGALDPAFAGDGRAEFAAPAGAPFGAGVSELVRSPDGSITAVGIGRTTASVNQVLVLRLADVGTVPGPGPSEEEPPPSGGGAVVTGGGSPTTQDPGPGAVPEQQAPSQDAPPAVQSGPPGVHRPAAWFHRVRRATALNGEADQGAARIQVTIVRRDGRRCATVTSSRRARLGTPATCRTLKTRWLEATLTPRRGQTTTWALRLGARVPAGRYVATVRALDQEGLAGKTGQVTFRVRR